MGKPWARLEIDFINHPKFRALSASAICLWIEGKNYCDKWHTDGLIPTFEMKHFRFYALKFLYELTHSGGPKGDGTALAPLLDIDPEGYRMHDYLEHNDDREDVLGRIEHAEMARERDREYKAKGRAAKKAKREDVRSDVRSDKLQDKSPDTLNLSGQKSGSITDTDTDTDTESDPQKFKEQTSEGGRASAPPPPRPGSPIQDNSHRKHAVCGRVCLHASLFNDFVRRRNHPAADGEIRAWAAGVIDEWTFGAFETVEPGDPFEFWKARYAEQWPAASAAQPSRLPKWTQ